jgi:hypothetical protein
MTFKQLLQTEAATTLRCEEAARAILDTEQADKAGAWQDWPEETEQ